MEKEWPKKIVRLQSGTSFEKKLFYKTNNNYYYLISWIIFAFIHIINVVKFTVYTHAR